MSEKQDSKSSSDAEKAVVTDFEALEAVALPDFDDSNINKDADIAGLLGA